MLVFQQTTLVMLMRPALGQHQLRRVMALRKISQHPRAPISDVTLECFEGSNSHAAVFSMP